MSDTQCLCHGHDEYLRRIPARFDRVRTGPSRPTHPVRRAMKHALAMIGLGVGGVAAVDDEEAQGLG